MGISLDYVNKAKRVQEFSDNQMQMDDIQNIVNEISVVCEQACRELEVELKRIKKKIDEKR
jgi:hypothetical protein